jgi:hypothetical protein
MVDIIILDRIAEVLQLRNTADPDDARAGVIGDLYRVRNMLVHGPGMPQVKGPTARDVIDRAVRLLTELAELEMTSLGTANVRRVRSRATAGRVADILTRHAEQEDRLGQDDAPVRLTEVRPDLAESAASCAANEVPAERATQPAQALRAMTPSSAGVSGKLQRDGLRGEPAVTGGVAAIGVAAIAETGTSELVDGVPHSARIWNYWLDGTDNYAVDREAGEAYKEIFPDIAVVARTSRGFLTRAVRYLAADAGMRQFLDIGTGLPTASNTHQVAQSVAPDSKVVYVDNDPLVLAHARALLTSSPEGATEYLDADIRNPVAILDAAAGLLDFTQPVALMLMGIMGHFTDDEAYPIVGQLLAGLPSGSYFALYDGANTNEAFNQAQEGYNASGAVPYHLRSPAQVERFFEGLELVEPGVVPVPHWRPDPDAEPVEIYSYCGVGRKP